MRITFVSESSGSLSDVRCFRTLSTRALDIGVDIKNFLGSCRYFGFGLLDADVKFGQLLAHRVRTQRLFLADDRQDRDRGEKRDGGRRKRGL
jgi:hypothetical protein